MRYRLVGTYLVLLALVLLALETPLAANVAAGRTQSMVIDRNVDAARFASLADPALRTGETITLTDELRRYYELYGIPAAVSDRDGNAVQLVVAAQLIGERDRRSEEHTSELQSQSNLVCRLLLEQ